MQYRYRYITTSTFTPAIEWHFFKLRAVPCQNEFQRLLSSRIEVSPTCHLNENLDGLGNVVQWGSFDFAHMTFSIVSEGVVEQSQPYRLNEEPAAYYRTPTRLTSASDEMQRAASSCMPPESTVFARARTLMHLVHRHITYAPGSTTTDTTAIEVWNTRVGVCQDFAHLMIALCRAQGIHARYANGLIMGEGQTHAWVEVSDGQQWLPFDPTHDVEPLYGYVKIAHGRDADDCPTNRGRFYSWTHEVMNAQTILNEEKDPADQQ